MTTLFIDIETRSRADLTKTGVYRYCEDPEFQILMAAWSVDGGLVTVETDPEGIFNIPGLWDPEVLHVSHNASFERVCLSRFAGRDLGDYLDPAEWFDTMAVAAEFGYPQSLGRLAVALGAEPKDEAGTRLINTFCVPSRKGEWVTAADKPEAWEEFVSYCAQDVSTLIGVYARLGAWPTEMERRVWVADQRVNDRGILVDTALAAAALEAADENRMLDDLRIQQIAGIDNPGSGPQLTAWLAKTGLEVPDLKAATVQGLIEGDLTEDQRTVLELRQSLALVAAKKFSAALDSVSPDDRLRGSFRFFGAHTGRWTGRGVQLQNLPRASLEDDAAVEAAVLDLHMGAGADAETLKALVRPMFLGPMTVVDYAAIEARVLAWMADETWALEAFNAGRDIYTETAQRMKVPTRAQGKVAVLALGYAGGIGSLRAMGATGTDETLEMMVAQWRRANRRIVSLWSKMNDAFRLGGRVGRHITVEAEGDSRYIRLPSGRVIGYHDCAFGSRATFTDPRRGGTRADTYGGRLVENATQAIARDILAEALVRLDDAGLDVIGHVHDEILVEGAYSVEAVSEIMTAVPEWATGMPIDGAGFSCTRYRKG